MVSSNDPPYLSCRPVPEQARSLHRSSRLDLEEAVSSSRWRRWLSFSKSVTEEAKEGRGGPRGHRFRGGSEFGRGGEFNASLRLKSLVVLLLALTAVETDLSSPFAGNGLQAELKRWQDPSTKEVFLIDSRTGHSFPALTKRTSGRNEDDVEDVEEEEEEPGGWTKRMSLKREGESCGTEKKEVPSWLESTLKVRPRLLLSAYFRQGSIANKLDILYLNLTSQDWTNREPFALLRSRRVV